MIQFLRITIVSLYHHREALIIFPLLGLLLLAISGCTDLPAPSGDAEGLPLVVEGWIEEGEHPVVMVTRALDLNDEQSRIEDAVEKWCRVTVYDDETPYILTARKNTDYNPNLIFTSGRLRGEVGHTYKLVVETEDTIASASATMLPGPSILRLEPAAVGNCDSLFTVRAYLSDLCEGGYYKMFCKSGTDRRHFPSFLGNLTADEYDPSAGITISRGPHAAFLENESDFNHYFSKGESVEVKVCRTDERVYAFWKAYDMNVSLSHNMFLNFVSDCPGNVEGAKGYWAAYSSALKICRMPASASSGQSSQ